MSDTGSRIIVALDFSSEKKVFDIVSRLSPELCRLKVGKELFTHFGPSLVQELIAMGYDVFLDLKFHDIPNTVAKACTAAANMGVWMVNVHASGGSEMLIAARDAIDSAQHRPLLIAVTVLTSMQQKDLQEIGVNNSVEQQVIRLAKLSNRLRLDGVVCSAHESKILKQECGENFCLVTPGIRLNTGVSHDQKRVMTPAEAINNGSDYLVIGRAVTEASDPKMVLEQINSSLL
jgi:orotidine-5'-phosphate decarboxylase